MLVCWLAAALACGASACTPVPRGVAAGLPPRAAGPATRHEGVPGLGNLAQVDAGLWRSAQPTAEGFVAARGLGIRTVLNLRTAHEDGPRAAPAGLAVVDLPMHQWSVDEADLVAALRIVSDPARRPVLVHCAQGCDRTGAVVAAYRRVYQGWAAEDAVREMRSFGMAPFWLQLPALVRRLDPEALRARIGEPSLPSVGLRAPAATAR